MELLTNLFPKGFHWLATIFFCPHGMISKAFHHIFPPCSSSRGSVKVPALSGKILLVVLPIFFTATTIFPPHSLHMFQYWTHRVPKFKSELCEKFVIHCDIFIFIKHLHLKLSTHLCMYDVRLTLNGSNKKHHLNTGDDCYVLKFIKLGTYCAGHADMFLPCSIGLRLT
jgi:hypothetical protein